MVYVNYQKKFDEFDGVKKKDESHIRIMSSNVLHTRDGYSRDLANLKQVSYMDRAEHLSKLYLTFMPDFLGLQEVSYEMEPEFLARLAEVYATPDTKLGDLNTFPYHGADHTQNHTPIFYNKLKYEVIESRFHLFEAGGLWSYQWALYRSKEDPTLKFIHMNLHYPSSSAYAYFDSAVEDVHDELLHLRRHYPDVAICVTGDYNCRYTTERYQNMVRDLPMTSGMLVAEDGQPDEKIIDHETVTTDLLDVKMHRSFWCKKMEHLTDHPATYVDVVYKK